MASDSKPYEGAHLQAPYYLVVAGLSYESLGTLLQGVREFGPGAYNVLNGKQQLFQVHLYDDGNWDFQSPQLTLFQRSFANREENKKSGHAAAAKRERQNVAPRDSLNPHPSDEQSPHTLT